MEKTNFKTPVLTSVLLFVLVAAMVLSFGACAKSGNNTASSVSSSSAATSVASKADKQSSQVLGQGKTSFTFEVVQKDKTKTVFTIKTDEKTVGSALVKLNLIAGDKSAAGLYVKSVNGITADYDIDGTYWAFYVNGVYATQGVDSTKIVSGSTYSFKIE